ncbi:endonuclease III domain-containing protein [uncultured Sphingomonas sp.]|uniref:endonuclease III domain-containing protein n=1 Tax=uncultured Sphingomonas sp. TaxID=158754 RepID=UPI0035CBD504
MQRAFAFGEDGPDRWSAVLVPFFGAALPRTRRTPFGQLIKSMLSARTRDAVSIAAYDVLMARYPGPRALAAAAPADIEAVVAAITFAPNKATNIAAALRMIGRERPDFDLAFLATMPLADALAWLERLPGVARKVAASVLNLSTLNRPVFVVDAHVARVLRRLGHVGRTADGEAVSEAVTAAMADWSGDDFALFHTVTKRLGQEVCRWDVPECGRCPLAEDCPRARASRA